MPKRVYFCLYHFRFLYCFLSCFFSSHACFAWHWLDQLAAASFNLMRPNYASLLPNIFIFTLTLSLSVSTPTFFSLTFFPLVTRQNWLANAQNPSKRVEIDVKCIELNWFTIQLSIIMLADLYLWPSQTKHSLESGTKRNRLSYRLVALLWHKTFAGNKVLVKKLSGIL